MRRADPSVPGDTARQKELLPTGRTDYFIQTDWIGAIPDKENDLLYAGY